MEHIISSGVLNVTISDHLPVFLIKKKQKIKTTFTYTRGRTYVNYRKDDFQADIKNHPGWIDFWLLEENKPDEMWDMVLEIITETANSHCPFTNMKLREDTPEWINKDMISEINLKDSLQNRAKRLDTPESWETFRKKKNEVKKLLSTAKENYVKGKLNELEGNPRKFWRTLNDISGLGKNEKGRKCSKLTDENGNTYEKQDAAEFLNNFYANVGPNLAEKHNNKWVKEDCKINVSSSFTFQWVNENEVKRLIKEIDITKSSAIEGLSTRLIKDAFEVLTFELAYIYNSCLCYGIFPKAWGLSKITPIPKTKTPSTKPTDWRPISQICIAGKLLEKIIHNQLYHYLDVNNILSENQYGFRKGLSTSIAIFNVLKKLYDNWNDKNFSGCIFIDFSKAFDTIDHEILTAKFELYGLDKTSQKFMFEYMSYRKHCTTVEGHTSSNTPVTYGTAQGSILGPLIFILYVNDMFSSINQENSMFMYADDTLILTKSDDITEVTAKAEKALENVLYWCELNKLSINYQKTKYMIVKHTKSSSDPSIVLNGSKITTVNQYEYLGMLLDDKLTMNEYVDSMLKITNSKIGILAKIRRFISEKTAARIYKIMIRPHLDYIDFVVDSASAGRVKKLDNLQRKAVRRIEYCTAKENRLDYMALQDKYNIEDLRLRRKRNLVKIIHSQRKTLKVMDPNDYTKKLRSVNKVKITNDFTSINRVFNSPLYRGARLWNTLPADLQSEKDKFAFRKRIKTLSF